MKKNLTLKSIIQSTLLGSVSCFILSSCEPSTEYKKVVINNSSKNLTLIVKSNYPTVIDSIALNSGESYYVENEEEMGYSDENYSDCTKGDKDLSFVHPTDSNEIYFHDSPNWMNEHKEKNNGKNHAVTCTYLITDSNF